MHTAKEQLVLYHDPGEQSVAIGTDVLARLGTMLTELGFIGKPLSEEDGGLYRAGEDFFEHLVYLGCSPVVRFADGTADEEQAGTCVALGSGYKLIYGRNTTVPVCSRCKGRLTGWVERLQRTAQGPAAVCASCQTPVALSALNWRRRAALGSLFVGVHGVFPHEAVPGEKLLEGLQSLTGAAWRYSYVQQPVVVALDRI